MGDSVLPPGVEDTITRLIESGMAAHALSACGGDPLEADPLACAEKITSTDYKDEEAGEGLENPATRLGFLLMQAQSRMKKVAALDADDTHFSMTADEYRRIVEDVGFELVLDVLFTNKARYSGEKDHDEHFYIYWLNGLLLRWSTYNGNLNNAQIYLNLKGKAPYHNTLAKYQISGGIETIDKSKPIVKFGKEGYWDNAVHVGYVDARECLRKKVQMFQEEVIILPKWIKRPFLWFVHYEEEHEAKDAGVDISYEEITEQRIALFPEEIREAITP